MRTSRTKQVLAAATATAALAGFTLPNATAVTSPVGDDQTASETATDSRVGSLVKPTKAQADAVSAIIKASPGARATWDARFGTPRTITPALGRTLTAPRAGSAVSIARAWLAANREALGLSAADVTALQLRRDHEIPGTGTHVIDFKQVFSGIAADRGGSLGLAVRKDGSILNYTGETVRAGSLTGVVRPDQLRSPVEGRRPAGERQRLHPDQGRYRGRV